jgi:ribosomal protein L3 glutamine methyltransferase
MKSAYHTSHRFLSEVDDSFERQHNRIIDVLRRTTSVLEKAKLSYGHGTCDAAEEALVLILHTLGLPIDTPTSSISSKSITNTQIDDIKRIVDERVTSRKPLAYLLKGIYQQGEFFYVDEGVIIPRSFIAEILHELNNQWIASENEDQLINLRKVHSVLDLCTGSGCLALLAAKYLPAATRIDAVDICGRALKVAQKNVLAKNNEGFVRLYQGDLYDALNTSPLPIINGEQHTLQNDLHSNARSEQFIAAGGIASHVSSKSRPAASSSSSSGGGDLRLKLKYDLILSNPPYVDDVGMRRLPPEYLHEPSIALSGGKDGLQLIHRILHGAVDRLTNTGGLILEIGRCLPQLEKAYPLITKEAVWIDTTLSSDEVFYIDKAALKLVLHNSKFAVL